MRDSRDVSDIPKLYKIAKSYFESEELISTAALQGKLSIPYFKARIILDKMIDEGFCSQQIGSMPCLILAKKN